MSDLDPMRIELREHLLAHAVRTGDFVLKSGRKSNWFIDGKQTVCTPEGIQLIAQIILGEIDGIDAIGGLTMGADPVAYGVAAIAAD
ncbi:MAG TPA: orotate phosphoribosyltransferase, partial [Acidimicrobiaceae bacterium]|nr:orotate phosphoribosyltransferase [Acidimicrobiaceae bacterium]